MASSSASTSTTTIAASTLTRPRIAIALVSAIATVSLGYYYYYNQPFATNEADPTSPGSGPGLHRRNALRRPRPRTRDDSSSSESHADENADENVDGNDSVLLPLTNTDVDAGADPNAHVAHVDPHPDPNYSPPPFEWPEEPSPPVRPRTGENIVTLLFRVSEDNARRNAYVHRGCLCNGCSMLPIRGIRYRCANCADFDLCEVCESQGLHNKTHVFYKVRVPVPSSAPRHVQPAWYPGDPDGVHRNLPRHLLLKWSHDTGFERVELDALWEQWTFMANTEWRDDPNALGLAMDRKTFERCLVPSAGYRHPAPNLIHDRMFAFYDTNHDDLIGFEEFLHGVSYKKRRDKLRRIFDGYDIDGDGYVSRRDFLRMFRAYYVSYKQMHRDTVQGLDDYMMTTIEAQQLVNSRQPLSGLFGRDGRIPEADQGRPLAGKVFRSTGEVEVHDGKGAVEEDKPDTSSREDILRELFSRNTNQGFFTESFGSPGRPQSPSRDALYWSGILNPPRNTGDLASVLSGDRAQFDDIIDSISHREPTLFVPETSVSDSSEEDDESTHDDPMDDEGEMSHPSPDENAVPSMFLGTPDARRFMNTLPTNIQLHPRPEAFAGPPRMNLEKRKRIVARKQLYERWKRRQFYLDEEEGASPPQGWREEQDILANVDDTLESSKSVPPVASPRPRSSSKVRFAEDTDEFETRSNPSTSSRSMPERWGGMEIPDAERDAGKEILYQVTQEALNELLDCLFKKKEDLAVRAAETKEQREKYRELLDQLGQDEEEEPTREPSDRPTFQSPADRLAIQDRNLQELLVMSGYSIDGPDAVDGEPSNEASRGQGRDIEEGTQSDEVGNPRLGRSLSDESIPTVAEYRDPTMPQFRPNSIFAQLPRDDAQGQSMSVSNASDASARSREAFSDPESCTARTMPPNTTDRLGPVPRSVLVGWKRLDEAEQEAKDRGGWGRLSYVEFEEIYREHDFQDGSKNRLAYLGSWIDFCIPS